MGASRTSGLQQCTATQSKHTRTRMDEHRDPATFVQSWMRCACGAMTTASQLNSDGKPPAETKTERERAGSLPPADAADAMAAVVARADDGAVPPLRMLLLSATPGCAALFPRPSDGRTSLPFDSLSVRRNLFAAFVRFAPKAEEENDGSGAAKGKTFATERTAGASGQEQGGEGGGMDRGRAGCAGLCAAVLCDHCSRCAPDAALIIRPSA